MKNIAALIAGVLFSSCSVYGQSKNAVKASAGTGFEINIENKQDIIQQVLDLPKFQCFYHPEIPQRLPVKLLDNDALYGKLNLVKFNQNVRLLDLSELQAMGAEDYVEVKELRLLSDTLFFSIGYPAEGAFAKGWFVKNNGKWIVGAYEVGEY